MCKEQTASIRTPNRSVGWFYVRFCILNGLQTTPASVYISFVQKFRGSGRADVSSRSSVSSSLGKDPGKEVDLGATFHEVTFPC